MINTSYNILLSKNAIRESWHEDDITSKLGIEVTQEWASYPVSSIIRVLTPQTQFTVPSNKRKPYSIDFVFTKGWTPLYFAFECKKIVQMDNNQIKNYIIKGVLRYITGKYSASVLEGGMIGYLFKNNIFDVVSEINKKISATLGLGKNNELKNKNNLAQDIPIYYSNHIRKSDKNCFKIYHLFLNF